MKRRHLGALSGTALVLLVAAACSAATSPLPVGQPQGTAEQVVFYFGLPYDRQALRDAARTAATPGSTGYRVFPRDVEAATRYGAADAQIRSAAEAVASQGLSFTADPTRLFARVSGTSQQWERALGAGLLKTPATSAYPFDAYAFAAAPSFAGLTDLGAPGSVYRSDRDGNRPAAGANVRGVPHAPVPAGVAAWPHNDGTPLGPACASGYLQARAVYAPLQVQQAYGLDVLQGTVADPAAATVSVIDLGGGFSGNDVAAAADCFGYTPAHLRVTRGDGVGQAIVNNSDETELDLQTVAATLPGATVRLVQATNGAGALLDSVSRAIAADDRGLPDAVTMSYGGCTLAETTLPRLVRTLDDTLAMAAVQGVSTFIAAGDQGSTVCGKVVNGPSQSFPASSPWTTAVGGTRLSLGAGNRRTGEVTWNDSRYGVSGAGSGGASRVFPRPWYQPAGGPSGESRGVPDIAALAAIIPGWPVVRDRQLTSVGGTSGATPFVAAGIALLNRRERQAARPPVGFVNPWLYGAASTPGVVFDVIAGDNDLAKVGCCTAGPGYDLTTGLGVLRFDSLAGHVPAPAK